VACVLLLLVGLAFAYLFWAWCEYTPSPLIHSYAATLPVVSEGKKGAI